MNITLTNKIQPPVVNLKTDNRKNNQPQFNGIYSKATEAMSNHYTMNMYTSKVAKFLAGKTEKLDSVVNGMQILGSVIVSGMYMIQTLRNNKLDDDRRKTLALNQLLTFLAATACGIFVDNKLDTWWEKKVKNYAKRQLKNENQIKDIERCVDVKKYGSTAKYVKEILKNDELARLLRGMGILKKLLVFTMMYRFLVPVAVTPLATVLGDKYLEFKTGKGNPKVNKKA